VLQSRTSAACKPWWRSAACYRHRGGLPGCLNGSHRGRPSSTTRKLGEWLPPDHISTALLTGSRPRPRRQELLQDLANGAVEAAGRHNSTPCSKTRCSSAPAWPGGGPMNSTASSCASATACWQRDSSPIAHDDGQAHRSRARPGPSPCMDDAGGEVKNRRLPPGPLRRCVPNCCGRSQPAAGPTPRSSQPGGPGSCCGLIVGLPLV